MDIYVISLDSLLIGASARLQGAEELKADYIAKQLRACTGLSEAKAAEHRRYLDRVVTIANLELQHVD